MAVSHATFHIFHATDHSNPHAKKKMYDFIHKLSPGVAPFQSPYHAMLEALDKVASLRVTGLLLEVRQLRMQEKV